jgi:glutamate/tyrosine decarboxylase-like PLP-dependent enzyme
LFNPPALPAGIIGDLITAGVNPQLAVWSHAPAAAEMEQAVLNHFGKVIWDRDPAGCFTSGGTEANAISLACALSRKSKSWPELGVETGGPRLSIYASSESHLAWIKIARNAGLGSHAVRLVAPADGLRLGGRELSEAVSADTDRAALMIVGTAGTTAHGSIDHLGELAHVAEETGAYFHVDAAWAGGLLLDPAYRPYFPHIERADSVTIDPHKWLAVPMGAGMFLGQDWGLLHRAYDVTTSYMPSASTEVHDAYIHSPQWSRRFIGGKVFAALMHHGVSGYGEIFDRQIFLGGLLKRELIAAGWRIVNDTDLPVICFLPPEECGTTVQQIVERIHQAGEFWISHVTVRGETVLRACVTSFETRDEDVRALVAHLGSLI